MKVNSLHHHMHIPLPPPPFADKMLIVGRWVFDQLGQPQVDMGQVAAPDNANVFEFTKNDLTWCHTMRLFVSRRCGTGWIPLFFADAQNIAGIGWQWLSFKPQEQIVILLEAIKPPPPAPWPPPAKPLRSNTEYGAIVSKLLLSKPSPAPKPKPKTEPQKPSIPTGCTPPRITRHWKLHPALEEGLYSCWQRAKYVTHA